MRIIVSTCDRYDHLLPGFAMQWNRYWGASVTVVGFRQPPELPHNFTFHSMEPVETRAFSSNLRRFVRGLRDDRLIFLFDDYWLTSPVNNDKVNRMSGWIDAGAVKADLSGNTNYFAHRDLGDGFVEATKDAHYRTSTQPAIWRRDFLVKLLGYGMNPWQFELQNNPAVEEGRIIGPEREIIQFANIYYKGAPDMGMIDKIPADDRAELRAAGAMDFIVTP